MHRDTIKKVQLDFLKGLVHLYRKNVKGDLTLDTLHTSEVPTVPASRVAGLSAPPQLFRWSGDLKSALLPLVRTALLGLTRSIHCNHGQSESIWSFPEVLHRKRGEQEFRVPGPLGQLWGCWQFGGPEGRYNGDWGRIAVYSIMSPLHFFSVKVN